MHALKFTTRAESLHKDEALFFWVAINHCLQCKAAENHEQHPSPDLGNWFYGHIMDASLRDGRRLVEFPASDKYIKQVKVEAALDTLLVTPHASGGGAEGLQSDLC